MDWFLYDNGLLHERVNDVWLEFMKEVLKILGEIWLRINNNTSNYFQNIGVSI